MLPVVSLCSLLGGHIPTRKVVTAFRTHSWLARKGSKHGHEPVQRTSGTAQPMSMVIFQGSTRFG